jgi:hypothetical protein
MNVNMYIVAATALLPLIIGFIWYNPKVMGTVWMKETGITPDPENPPKMVPILIANLVAGLFLAMGLMFIVIHQQAIYSVLANEPGLNEKGSLLNTYVADFMAKYGQNFRTFKHGALHGFMTAVTLALPIVSVSSLWEQRSWKYIWLTFGYWAITMMLMGGIICQFA